MGLRQCYLQRNGLLLCVTLLYVSMYGNPMARNNGQNSLVLIFNERKSNEQRF